MRCTDCHRPIKPVVALDIDGTLGDYHSHFIRFLGAYLNADWEGAELLYDGSVNFGDWVCDEWGIDRRTYRDIKLAYRQGAQKRSMPLFTGARELTERISALGAEIWLTTSRPYLRLDNVDPDTRAWLERHRIQYDHLLYDDNKYRVLAGQVEVGRVVAVMDDLPEMYDQARDCFGSWTSILRSTRWNRAVVRRPAVQDLEKAWSLISWRIENWYKYNPRTAA